MTLYVIINNTYGVQSIVAIYSDLGFAKDDLNFLRDNNPQNTYQLLEFELQNDLRYLEKGLIDNDNNR